MKTSESNFCACLYFTSGSLARKVEKLAIASWKPVGLPPSHGYLLKLAIQEPGITAGAIAKQLQLTPSTVTRLIEKLEEKGLLSRSTEGKMTNVYATQAGKDLLPAMDKCVAAFYKAYTGILGEENSWQAVKDIAALADRID